MNILLISAWYYPLNQPRAHRWSSIAAHWASQGHRVHVVTARHREAAKESVHEGVFIHRIGFDSLKSIFYYYSGDPGARGRVGAPVGMPGPAGRLAQWVYQNIWKKLYFPDDACVWRWSAQRKIRALIAQENIEVVYSVSLPFTGHVLGRAMRRRYPGLRWVADIGDPFSFADFPLNNTFLYGQANRRLERAVLLEADATVVTTELAKRQYEQLFGAVTIQHMRVIPPLLHPPPHFPAVAPPRSVGPLKIAYFGALYAPVRTPDAFLQLLDEAMQRIPDLYTQLEIHFYGEIFPEFYPSLRRNPLIRLHGLQSRQTVRAAMVGVDALLHIGNQTVFQLPSKAVEYAAAGKPIVHLSYTEPDAFVEFWGGRPGLIVLPVREGRVTEAGVALWLELLRGQIPLEPITPDAAWLQSCSVESVAEGYLVAAQQ